MKTFDFDSNKARDYYWNLLANPNVSVDEKIIMHAFINEVRKVVIDCNDECPNQLVLQPIAKRYEKPICDFFKFMGFEIIQMQFFTLSTNLRIKKV